MLTPLWFKEPQNIFPILAEVNTDLPKYPKETINFDFSNLQCVDDVYFPHLQVNSPNSLKISHFYRMITPYPPPLLSSLKCVSSIVSKYGVISGMYSVRIQENTDQK